MKVSKNWLQTFFAKPLPSAAELERALTFHSSEIEEVVDVGADAVLDVNVLPDKSAWMLSHRGVAKELSVILDIPMSHDPFAEPPVLMPEDQDTRITLDTDRCDRYSAARLTGVTVEQSPTWLRERLEAIGQRPINNIVDATNYVMFHLGQPLHAFDAEKLSDGDPRAITVRQAREGEEITTLTSESYTLTPEDMLIVDGGDAPIGIAGIKGGKRAEVDQNTTEIIIESAHFDRVAIRKSSQRLKLRTDASARFENGVVPALTAYGLREVVALIRDIAGGEVAGYADVNNATTTREPVSVSLEKVNSVLGVTLSESDVADILRRFGYEHTIEMGVVTVVPPFERDDLVIREDVIEEIGRMYGLTHIHARQPEPRPLPHVNASFYYAEAVRDTLTGLGFSEVFTSSFREQDEVALENALAADKSFLRSNLRENISDALTRNVYNKDLLGLERIKIFEIGSVFTEAGGQRSEHTALALGVRTGAQYKPKQDDAPLQEAVDALASILGECAPTIREGVAEYNFDDCSKALPEPDAYVPYTKEADATYTPVSPYPFISRDIALWVDTETDALEVERVLRDSAGELCVRITLFDTFTKDGRTSYAFRLVFQSSERTLTDDEANTCMNALYAAATERGWEVR